MYQLKVNQQQSIIARRQQGWSGRRIARELGLDRGTAAKYLAPEPKPTANPQPGSEATDPAKPARTRLGRVRVDAPELPFWRMESAPGQKLQADFGLGGWVIEQGKADGLRT